MFGVALTTLFSYRVDFLLGGFVDTFSQQQGKRRNYITGSCQIDDAVHIGIGEWTVAVSFFDDDFLFFSTVCG